MPTVEVSSAAPTVPVQLVDLSGNLPVRALVRVAVTGWTGTAPTDATSVWVGDASVSPTNGVRIRTDTPVEILLSGEVIELWAVGQQGQVPSLFVTASPAG